MVDVKVVPDLLQVIALRARLEDLDGVPVININDVPLQGLNAIVKRAIDIGISAAALLVLALPLAVLASLVKLTSRGPIFYRQERMGLDGKPFMIYKFRSMYEDAEAVSGPVFASANDPRRTPLGKLLRRSNVDELPQLWNVLKGEMSIVGPRPLPYDEANQATGLFRARTSVRPGLAGPWQAYGRSNIPFEDMIRLDYSYAVGWSMAEDMRLLLRTANAVFGRRGAY
jgi:lipopolysaccharide/colanic/teichoic acid biosynthesis glycosyltransferase